MGTFRYGNMSTGIELDDRALAHLQAVVATKLRRGEGFFLNWVDDPAVGSERHAAWIGPNVPVFFTYSSAAHVDLRREWLETMTMSANSNGGLMLGEEPPVA